MWRRTDRGVCVMNLETMVHGQHDWCLQECCNCTCTNLYTTQHTIKMTILSTHKFQKRDSGGS